jgi:hypothetical protein
MFVQWPELIELVTVYNIPTQNKLIWIKVEYFFMFLRISEVPNTVQSTFIKIDGGSGAQFGSTAHGGRGLQGRAFERTMCLLPLLMEGTNLMLFQ